MKDMNPQQLSLLIRKQKSKASFVKVKKGIYQTFKYKLRHYISLCSAKRFFQKFYLYMKRNFFTIFSHGKFFSERVLWKDLFQEVSVWFLEVMIEGLLANFVVKQFFGMPMTFGSMLAYGILLKVSMSKIKEVFSLLGKDGAIKEVHNK